jgi:peptide/nickel transport system permease protein
MEFQRVYKRFIKNPSAIFGTLLLVGFTIIAIWAPVFAPVPESSRDPYLIPHDGFSPIPQPPSEDHIFGTMDGQHDIYYGVIWGTRTAFRIGGVITISTTIIGIIVGSVSGFFGGWIDEILMRITEIFQTFPFLLAALTLTSVFHVVYERRDSEIIMLFTKFLAFITFGHDWNIPVDPVQMPVIAGVFAIMLFGWMTIARVTRGNILTVKSFDYSLAARAIGATNARILFVHLLPNAIFPVLVISSMNIGSYILTNATLNFLGLGSQRGYADWGQMINFARNWIPSLSEYWYILVFPGGAIMLFVLAWNLVGDAIRDIFDPKLRGVE